MSPWPAGHARQAPQASLASAFGTKVWVGWRVWSRSKLTVTSKASLRPNSSEVIVAFIPIEIRPRFSNLQTVLHFFLRRSFCKAWVGKRLSDDGSAGFIWVAQRNAETNLAPNLCRLRGISLLAP